MRLRYHNIYIIGFLAFSIVAILFSDIEPTGLYKPDIWAGISIALGASILTLVGIVTSILTSNENNRRAEFSDILSEIFNKLGEKSKTNPDKRLSKVYDNSQEKIKSLLEKMEPLMYQDGVLGLLSFLFLCLSALSAIWGYPFKFILLSFIVGVGFLGGYVVYYYEECMNMDKISKIPEKKGQLKLLSIKIDGEPYHFEVKGNEAFFPLSQEPKRIELMVEFKGNARNGFLDAFVKYTNDLYSYIPDSNTCLSDFGFTDNYRLTLLEGGKFDTGVLQLTDKTLEMSFDIVLRSEKNILLTKGIVNEQIRLIYKHCSVPEDFVVDFIDVRLYEDPSFKPSYKRRIVDYITLRPERIEK
jgi:hypothetical protein